MNVLVVAGAPVEDVEAYRHILASAGVRVAVDRGADLCFALGWTPDLFVGDADSVSGGSLNRIIAQDVPRVLLPVDKEMTDLHVALEKAAEIADGPVHVTAIMGGRTDHMIVALGDLFAASTTGGFTVSEPTERAWLMSTAGIDTIALAPTGALVSVIAGPCGATVSLAGFRWNLDHSTLEPLSGRGLGNVITANAATIRVHAGSVFVHSTHPTSGACADTVPPSAL
ncbi:thiamine diphosphokinase [bacterium]|nr:thiamine diphosphokinase [bacterium]